MTRQLQTNKGSINLPAFLPVTTFGPKFPIDRILQPYLGRFANALMVSHHYAQEMKEPPDIPLFIDSGGFASLFEGSTFEDLGDTTGIRTKDETLLDPREVLTFQLNHAQIGATLDFLIPPNLDEQEMIYRQNMTIRNALWAVRQQIPQDFRLLASVQAWDANSATAIMMSLAEHPFAGFALGGMVPRISDPDTILRIVEAIRKVEANRPLHVFGIGQPVLIKRLFAAGVESVDSSTYVQQAVGKRYLNPQSGNYMPLSDITDPITCCSCRICQTFSLDYLSLEGELNNMAIALHNLQATYDYLDIPYDENTHTSYTPQ